MIRTCARRHRKGPESPRPLAVAVPKIADVRAPRTLRSLATRHIRALRLERRSGLLLRCATGLRLSGFRSLRRRRARSASATRGTCVPRCLPDRPAPFQSARTATAPLPRRQCNRRPTRHRPSGARRWAGGQRSRHPATEATRERRSRSSVTPSRAPQPGERPEGASKSGEVPSEGRERKAPGAFWGCRVTSPATTAQFIRLLRCPPFHETRRTEAQQLRRNHTVTASSAPRG